MSVRAEVRKDYALEVLAKVAAQKQAFFTEGRQPPKVGRAMQKLQSLHAQLMVEAKPRHAQLMKEAESASRAEEKVARKIKREEARRLREAQAALKAEEEEAARQRIASRAPMSNV